MNNKNVKIILLLIFIASVIALILHSALFTIVRNDYQRSAKILAEQILVNVYLAGIDPLDADKTASKINNFINTYPAEKIKITDKNDKEVFVNNNYAFNKKEKESVLDQISLYLIANSSSPSQVILNPEGKLGKNYKAVIAVKVPLDLKINKQEIDSFGSMIVYYDISREWQMLNNTRFFIINLLALVFSISYVLILNDRKINSNLIFQQDQEIQLQSKAMSQHYEQSELQQKYLDKIANSYQASLNIIIASAKLLTDKSEANKIINEARELLILSKNFVSDSEIIGDLVISKINLAELINSVITDLQHKIEQAQLSVEISLGDKIFINSDQKLLEKAFFKLISNIFILSPNNSNILISSELAENKQEIILIIKDQGIGQSDIEQNQELIERQNISKELIIKINGKLVYETLAADKVHVTKLYLPLTL